MNRLACLRLTERSARLLYNVRCEIQEAGDQVADELQHPIDKLTAALNEVYNFLTRLIRRPFIKRYLRRLEIMREIAACDRALADVLAMFGISIQVRILKQVQAVSEESRKLAEEAHEHYRLMQTRVYAMDQGRPQLQLPSLDNALGLTGVGEQRPGFGVHPVPTLGLLSPSSSMLSPPPVYSLDQITPTQSNQGTEMLTPSFSHHSIPSSQIILPPSASSIQQIQISEQLTQAVVQHTSEALSPLLTLAELRTTQNAVDSARDNAALRAALRKVMSSWSDEELIKQIQVGQEEIPEAIKTFRRALESLEDDEPDIQNEIDAIYPVRFEPDAAAVHAPGGSSSAPGETEARRRDTLDREFMESGIDAMTRLSSVQSQKARAVGADVDPKDLPSWTITRYEVDRLRKIGVGFFSEVYLGRWRDLSVAIKVLSSATTQSTFIREVLIWRELRHPNILRLYGASSTTGEKPWFFVSPYCAGGTLVAWLNAARDRARDRLGGHAVEMERGRSMFGMGSGSGGIGLSGNSHGVGTGVCEAAMANPKQIGRRVISSGNLDSRTGIEEIDLVRCMHQIAKGMEYLHDKGVLHGDLKAVNVLVDEIGRCIVSDFGQSEIKSEVYRISQKPLPRGTLRWQAPELLMGDGKLTAAVDVYAFSICCVEILGMGDLPWQLQDDTTVANLVRVRDSRPVIPMTRYTTTVAPLISSCWSRNPASRPTFGHIATALSQMRKRFDARGIEDKITPVDEENSDEVYEIVESSSSSSSHRLIPFRPAVASHRGHPNSQSFDDSKPVGMPEPVLYTPSRKYSLPSMGSGTCSSSASSVLTSSPEEKHLSPHNHGAHFGGYDSPPPTNEIFAAGRNERRYRILARDTHKFHSSLKLPLWSPSHVSLGAVGYLSKPKGEFITLFNAMNPPQSSGGKLMDMASLRGYGNFNIERQKPQNKRNAAQRGFLDPLAGLLTFKPKGGGSSSHRQQSVSRRYSFPLRAGHKEAHICAETTMYRYVDDVEPAKKWFKHNVNEIIQNYTPEHPIQREDIFVVIGALDAPDYALFVSHSHPEGQAYFNVFSPPKVGRAWGTFTTDSVSSSESGPSYHEEVPGNAVFAGKISDSRGGNVSSSKWDSLILARLRFKPDVDEPTSL
ncbi:hypothetical protein BJ138DRAFT_1135374 [Hygrophoropsis aurantiaca]|uniref:Uncharacterized protein n=1 Tax=Hygrophoropsis aurantiaca TaxID=72124 RepID=A0ACB8AEG9_9AGAM|nr:hypothetical protein BJ138DRAFT_1135374 [Hygrophoropsis aurantiaca]